MGKVMESTRRRAARLSPDKRHKQLLTCAVRVFARLGIGSVSHADVAQEGKVSVPTVFFYFPTKWALTDAVITEIDRFMTALVESALTTGSSTGEKLRAVLHAFAQVIDSNPDQVKVWLNWSTLIAEPTWSRYEIFQDRMFTIFEELIETGKEHDEIHGDINAVTGAHLIAGSGHMIAHMKFRHVDECIVSDYIETLINRTLSAS